MHWGGAAVKHQGGIVRRPYLSLYIYVYIYIYIYMYVYSTRWAGARADEERRARDPEGQPATLSAAA